MADPRADRDELLSELVSLCDEARKLLDMADRDGYLHPSTMYALPPIMIRVLLSSDRVWQARKREQAAE